MSVAQSSFERLLKRPVTLVTRTAGAVGPDGEQVVVEERLETICELQQSGSHEEGEGALNVTTWRVWLPAGTPAAGWDALELADGQLLELDGDPWRVVVPRTGVEHHVEALARSVR